MSVKSTPTLLHLAKHGRVLSTRELGREVADQLQDALKGGGVVLSFAGVEVATPSFLDEVLTRLRGILQSDDQAIAVVSGMNEDVMESLELVLQHRRLMLGAVIDDHIQLLGGKKQLKETLATAEKLGTFKATELADELKLKLPNLHQRLKALVEAGVVTREPDETAQRGRRHDYSVPDPKELTAITN